MAYAYVITRDIKYLQCAYEVAIELGKWTHWGPGHFLNCANTARPLATAYDWLYNDFVRVKGQEAVDALAKRIYENAVYEAQISLAGLLPQFVCCASCHSGTVPVCSSADRSISRETPRDPISI